MKAENIRDLLISSAQSKMMHVLITQLQPDKVGQIKDLLKQKYGVPSTWQLTKKEAGKIIDGLQKRVDKMQEDQAKMI